MSKDWRVGAYSGPVGHRNKVPRNAVRSYTDGAYGSLVRAAIKGIERFIFTYDNVDWLLGPLYEKDEPNYPDIGPFPTAEAAYTALLMMKD